MAIYMFERYDQKVIVWHLMVGFMSYCPHFWGSRAIYNDHKARYMFEGMTKNMSFSCFMAIFMSYCQRLWGSSGICMVRKTRYMFESYNQKNQHFRVFWPFS